MGPNEKKKEWGVQEGGRADGGAFADEMCGQCDDDDRGGGGGGLLDDETSIPIAATIV